MVLLCRLVLVIFLCIFSGQVMALDKLVIAVQPSANPEQLATQSAEIKAILEHEIGMPVEMFFPTNYAGVVEALHYGHAQVAFMGSWPALLATTKANARVLLAEVRDVYIGKQKEQQPYYFSYWVVKPESVAQSLKDLKGKKAAFPSQISSSGFVAPMSRMVELNLMASKNNQPVDPKDYFSDVLFSGGYAQGYEALKAGQVDVTVIAGDVPEQLYRDVLDHTRIIETQGPIPSHAVVISQDVGKELEAKIKNAFLMFNEPELVPLMRKFVSGLFVRFQNADASHLEGLNTMLKLSQIEFTEKK